MTETGQFSAASVTLSAVSSDGDVKTSAKPSAAIRKTSGQVAAHKPQLIHPSRSIVTFNFYTSPNTWISAWLIFLIFTPIKNLPIRHTNSFILFPAIYSIQVTIQSPIKGILIFRQNRENKISVSSSFQGKKWISFQFSCQVRWVCGLLKHNSLVLSR